MLKGTKNKWIYLAYYFRQLDQDKMRRFVRFASEKRQAGPAGLSGLMPYVPCSDIIPA